MNHDGIMPRRKLSFEWRNGKVRPRMMTDQEAFDDDRARDGETAALNRWFERQQPVWLLISEGNRG